MNTFRLLAFLLGLLAIRCFGIAEAGAAENPANDNNAAINNKADKDLVNRHPVNATEPSYATIQFTNQDHLTGALVGSQGVDSQVAGSFLWQSPAFAAPMRVALDHVASIYFPAPKSPLQPEGNFRFELDDGDALIGSLVALDDKEATLDVAGAGRLHVARGIVHRMFRWSHAESVFQGLDGLRGWSWNVSGAANAWREEGGRLVTDRPGDAIGRRFDVPARARFEIELSWTDKPDFELALCVEDGPKSAAPAFRFEVWENQLVVVRETEREADVASLLKLEAGPGRVRFQAFVDQNLGRILVVSASGQPLADLTVTSPKSRVAGNLQLVNRGGGLGLDCLRIDRWSGELPAALAAGAANQTRIRLADDKINHGQLKLFDAAQRQFVIDDGAGEQRVEESSVREIVFSQSAEPPLPATPAIRAAQFSGARVRGDLLKVEGNSLWLQCPGIQEPILMPLDSVSVIVGLKHRDAAADTTGRQGRLEAPGAVLHGRLADGSELTGGSLVWQTPYASAPSPLAPGIAARIIYREPPAPNPRAKQASSTRTRIRQVAPAPIAGAAVRVIIAGGVQAEPARQPQRIAAPATPAAAVTPILHLRSGDTIACAMSSIDENGVMFRTSVSDATFVPHDQIKALELMPDAPPAKIAIPKKERLLTLPRMQRDNPPTQLIRSVTGDYLRGRLVAMDDKELRVEIHLKTKTVPRDSVARIIWMRTDEAPAADQGAAEDGKPSAARVQGLTSDGARLTFFADRFAGSILSGRSPWLGSCRLDVGQLDQLLIGAAIEQAAASLAFHQWKLKPAPEPLAPSESGGEGSGSEGMESALIGKPAPDFNLKMLGGEKFQLAGAKEKVLVLDFWASWCGPCLQVMPQVDKVVREFADQNVALVAINLEETEERVQAALERLGLAMPVALDSDGRVAEKYGATSIPQTVIIARGGEVVRVFVGGGARFDDQLRESLKSVLSAEADKKKE